MTATSEKSSDFFATLTIPVRPKVVIDLMEERRRDEPDFNRIQKLVTTDVSLAAAVLKMANSPAYKRRGAVTGVGQAFQMLGLNSVMAVAMGVAMRQAMRGDDPVGLERFWDSAEATADMCAQVARRFRLVDADEAFSYGLFHDCGIPMLTARFPDYKDVLRKANASHEGNFTAVEDELIGTNHAVVGHFVARSWLFPDALCEAISMHHDLDAFEATDFKSGSARPLIAIGRVAEHIQHVRRRGSEDVEWDKFGDATLAYLRGRLGSYQRGLNPAGIRVQAERDPIYR